MLGLLTMPFGITLNEKFPCGAAMVTFGMDSSSKAIWWNPLSKSMVRPYIPYVKHWAYLLVFRFLRKTACCVGDEILSICQPHKIRGIWGYFKRKAGVSMISVISNASFPGLLLRCWWYRSFSVDKGWSCSGDSKLGFPQSVVQRSINHPWATASLAQGFSFVCHSYKCNILFFRHPEYKELCMLSAPKMPPMWCLDRSLPFHGPEFLVQ